MSEILNTIMYRVSSPRLSAPTPEKQELDIFFRCAVRAPDHGRIRPWRFVVLQGRALEDLGAAFEAAQPEADEAQKLRLRAMPLRAPMIIVTIAKLDPEHKKVPVWEQQVAAGIATQHIQLAAKELGYGSMWRTGPMTESAPVKAFFDLQSGEQIVAFLYVGRVDGEPREADFQSLDEIVEYRD